MDEVRSLIQSTYLGSIPGWLAKEELGRAAVEHPQPNGASSYFHRVNAKIPTGGIAVAPACALADGYI